ncbi:MAG: hypothetical protein ABI131_09540 [Nostocoides sp.]
MIRPLPRTSARRLAVGCVGLLLIAGCSGSGSASRSGSGSGSPAAAPGSPAATVDGPEREAALAALLDARARAITTHDRAAFSATLADPRSAYGTRQLAAYDAMALLPLADVGYGTVQVAPPLTTDRASELGPGAWVARVEGHYELAGYDTGPRTFDTYFTAVRATAGWRLADDVDGGSQPQPWDLPGMAVARSATSLVMGNVPEATLRAYLAIEDRAVSRVSAFWTRPWPRRLVVVAPATVPQMQGQLSAQQGDVSQVAAVTDGPIDRGSTAHSDRIVLNPVAFADLQPAGRTVVLTHESTHVAIRSSLPGRVPTWISEGTADLVGYSTVSLADNQIAGALVAQVKASGPPRALPVDSQFDAATTMIAPIYNQAWLAARLIDRAVGPSGLTRFYVASASAGSDSDVEAATAKAFRTVLRQTVAAFTITWLAEVRRVSGRR